MVLQSVTGHCLVSRFEPPGFSQSSAGDTPAVGELLGDAASKDCLTGRVTPARVAPVADHEHVARIGLSIDSPGAGCARMLPGQSRAPEESA
jgi:hypothetical protein